jgi:hypothetical protein
VSSPADGGTRDAGPAALLRRVAALAEGLVYSSESDRPLLPFHRAAAAVPIPLTPRAFTAMLGADADEPVEEWTLERFFLRHIECAAPEDEIASARLPRYDALRSLMQRELRDARVFRVGRVQVRCYVVGLDAGGDLIGLETVSIET